MKRRSLLRRQPRPSPPSPPPQLQNQQEDNTHHHQEQQQQDGYDDGHKNLSNPQQPENHEVDCTKKETKFPHVNGDVSCSAADTKVSEISQQRRQQQHQQPSSVSLLIPSSSSSSPLRRKYIVSHGVSSHSNKENQNSYSSASGIMNDSKYSTAAPNNSISCCAVTSATVSSSNIQQHQQHRTRRRQLPLAKWQRQKRVCYYYIDTVLFPALMIMLLLIAVGNIAMQHLSWPPTTMKTQASDAASLSLLSSSSNSLPRNNLRRRQQEQEQQSYMLSKMAYHLSPTPSSSSFSVDDWPWPSTSSTTSAAAAAAALPKLIHIVHTRFMQEQPDLLALGQARLKLFQSVCFPTLIEQQSTVEFLWLIRVDPQLHPELLHDLIQIVQEYPNVYVIKSNTNFRINKHFPGAWRGGAQEQDLRFGPPPLFSSLSSSSSSWNQTNSSTTTTKATSLMTNHDQNHNNDNLLSLSSDQQQQQQQQHRDENENHPASIYTGNQTLLELALALSEQLTVLETRLDADDGLHVRAIELIQQRAREAFFVSTTTSSRNQTTARAGATTENANFPDTEVVVAPLAAAASFKPSGIKWMYWCTRRDLEWHWTTTTIATAKEPSFSSSASAVVTNETKNAAAIEKLSFGILDATYHDKFCLTPGLTTGFAIGTKESDVPVFAHDRLAVDIPFLPIEQGCAVGTTTTTSTKDCLQFLDEGAGALPFTGLRSRTPTSAGMLHVVSPLEEELLRLAIAGKVSTTGPAPSAASDAEESGQTSPGTSGGGEGGPWWRQWIFWEFVQIHFGIDRTTLRAVNQYVADHLLEIAQDNLRGQCTSGHSCKEKAKKSLEVLITNGTSATAFLV